MSPRFVLFAVSPTASGRGRLRLFAATVAGRHLREIGPRRVRGLIPDSLFALDRQHIWLTAFSGGGGIERLYRTADGGQTWRSAAAPAHPVAGGSTDDIQFVNATDGWLSDEWPTALDEHLYRSTDSGQTWQLVAQMHTGAIPNLGDVWFAAGTGWLGGSSFGNPLYTSTDRGRQWRRPAIPAPPRGSSYALPGVFGPTVLAPVLSCLDHSRTVRLYRRDAAGTWSSGPGWRVPELPAPRFGCGQFSVAMPSQTVAWAVAFGDRTAVVGRTAGGRRWAPVANPVPKASFAAIHALDARRAWLLADGRIYVTIDGGQSWRSLRVP